MEIDGFQLSFNGKTAEIHKFTVPQLKEWLKSHGQKVSGRKEDLINRIQNFLENSAMLIQVTPETFSSLLPKMEFALAAPLLERAALIKIVTNVWKCWTNISETICSTEESEDFYINPLPNPIWRSINRIIETRLAKLALPPIMKLALNEISKNVGNELLEFLTSKRFTDRLELVPGYDVIGCNRLVDCVKHIEWTQHGKIDETKSARALSCANKPLSRKERLRIACVFGIRDLVEHFWRESPDNFTLSGSPFGRVMTSGLDGRNVVSKESKFGMLRCSLKSGNTSAMEYLWSTFTDEERVTCLDFSWKYAISLACYDVNIRRSVYFLLTKTNEQMLATIFPEFGSQLLEYFAMDWVYVDLFLAGLKRVLPKLCVVGFLLNCLAGQIELNRNDGKRFRMCFEQLWTRISPDSRNYFLQHEEYNCAACIKSLYAAEDFASLDLMLNDFDEEDRTKFMERCLER